jgi:hypothetical protein
MYDTILSCPNCGLEHRLVADNVVEHRDALIRAGDVLATRLDETPVPSRFGFEDLDKAKMQQQAVREWLAIAHPNGEGHVDATTVGERGERSGMTWDEATE